MENFKMNPGVWFEIYVQDMDRAVRFYETVLGISMQPMTDPTDSSIKMVSFGSPTEDSLPGASGALVEMNGVHSGGNSTIIYFGCRDTSIEESRVVSAGGQIFKSKMSIGEHGFMSLIVDTEGNMVGLHSME